MEGQKLIDKLYKHFALKDLGLVDYFLGIQIKQTSKGLHLSQTKYITDLLTKSKMQTVKCVSTPLTSRLSLSTFSSDIVENVQLYGSIVGASQYITITRPEISISVNKVCQFMQRPLTSH